LKSIVKLLSLTGLVIGFSACASADIVWTLDNVQFLGGETATGSFTTDNSLDTIESFSIAVTGGASGDFTATNSVGNFLPMDAAFFTLTPPAGVLNLFFAAPLTSAGGPVQINLGNDNLNPLLIGRSYNPEVVGVETSAVPEPLTIPVLAGGLILLGFALRRKLIPAS
jgi:hypothetical protein